MDKKEFLKQMGFTDRQIEMLMSEKVDLSDINELTWLYNSSLEKKKKNT